MLQVGTQRRRYPLHMEARRLVAAGQLGAVKLVTSYWLNHQADLPDRKLNGRLDWDLWVGPAPKRDIDAFRFFNWYYFWDYSGGLLVGQAAHIIDTIHWFMGSQAPAAVTCAGGRPNLKRVEVTDTAMACESLRSGRRVRFNTAAGRMES